MTKFTITTTNKYPHSKFCIHFYLNFVLRSVVRYLPENNGAPRVVGPHLQPIQIHLHVRRFSEYLGHQLYVIGQLLDLAAICNDANGNELARVNLRHQVRVMGEVLPRKEVLQLVGQHLL